MDYQFTGANGLPRMSEPLSANIPLSELDEVPNGEHSIEWYKKQLEIVTDCNGKLQRTICDQAEKIQELEKMELEDELLRADNKAYQKRIAELENHVRTDNGAVVENLQKRIAELESQLPKEG